MADASDVTLVQYPGLGPDTTLSPPCAKVRMALRFKGIAFRTRNLDLPQQVRKYNPRGRLPVLRIGADTIVDSSDILTELERRFPTPALEPTAAAERADVLVLEDWADEVLYFHALFLRWRVPENWARMRTEVLARLPAPARWAAPWVARREIGRRVRYQGVGLKGAEVVARELDACLDAVEARLGSRPWLVGSAPSRADLAVAAVLDQLRLARLTPAEAARIDARPAVAAWLERVHSVAGNAADPDVA